jgi:hypothetical protein
MKKSIWLGGLLGGVVAFLWGWVTWGVLPFHSSTLLKFKDEAPVLAALAANAPVPGVYLVPNGQAGAESLTPEQRKAQQEAAMKQWQSGPSAIMSVRTVGPSFGSILGAGVVIYLVSGLLLAWLVSRTSGLSYWGKVGFVVVTAITAGVLVNLPEWNWWGFSTGYTAVAFFDLIVAWFLGGLVIAKFS